MRTAQLKCRPRGRRLSFLQSLTICPARPCRCAIPAFAFTLQIYGQKRTDPSIASLLMSFESVFALLGGMLILHQVPTLREAVGCALMFADILLIQIAPKKETAEELPAA